MIRPARFSALALVVLAPLLGVGTWTEPARAQDDVATQMARERFQEGVRFYDQKQYEKARAAFLQAYALRKHPAVLLNLAQSELRAKHEADAAKHFAQYLREASATGPERAEAEKGLAAAKAQVAEFTVTVELEGSEVYVNNNFEGRSPLPGPIYLPPGDHSVEARRDGKTATSTVNASAGQTGAVDLSFSTPSGPVGPVGPGPGPAGPGPAGAPGGPGPGQPGPGGSSGVSFDTADERRPFIEWASDTPVAWIGGGLTALGLIGGIAFSVSSSSNYSSADSIAEKIRVQAASDGVSGPCGPPPLTSPTNYTSACQKRQDRVDSGDSQKTLATVSFVVAGLAAGGTVAYYFIDGKEKPATGARQKRRTAFVPLISPSVAGLGFVGEL